MPIVPLSFFLFLLFPPSFLPSFLLLLISYSSFFSFLLPAFSFYFFCFPFLFILLPRRVLVSGVLYHCSPLSFLSLFLVVFLFSCYIFLYSDFFFDNLMFSPTFLCLEHVTFSLYLSFCSFFSFSIHIATFSLTYIIIFYYLFISRSFLSSISIALYHPRLPSRHPFLSLSTTILFFHLSHPPFIQPHSLPEIITPCYLSTLLPLFLLSLPPSIQSQSPLI